MITSRTLTSLTVVAVVAVAAACGSSSNSPAASSTSSTPSVPSSPGSSPPAGSTGGAGALTAETQAKAAGDIPDNQVFLVYRNAAAGYGIKYPEGWAIRGSNGDVTIQDKNNVVHIVADSGAATVAQAAADMQSLAASTPRFSSKPPVANPTCSNMVVATKLPLAAVHVVYTTQSKPDPVTGKRSLLSVDRYYMSKAGHRVIVDLGTPQGVDNVDAYCLMIASFQWK
jgi:hypothetical protein